MITPTRAMAFAPSSLHGRKVEMVSFKFPDSDHVATFKFLDELGSTVYMNADLIMQFDRLLHCYAPTDKLYFLNKIYQALGHPSISTIFFTDRDDAILFRLRTGATVIATTEVFLRNP